MIESAADSLAAVILETRTTRIEIPATGRSRLKSGQRNDFGQTSWNRTTAVQGQGSVTSQSLVNDQFQRQILFDIALKTMLVDSQGVHQHGFECNIEEDRASGKRIDRCWEIELPLVRWLSRKAAPLGGSDTNRRWMNEIERATETIKSEGIRSSGRGGQLKVQGEDRAADVDDRRSKETMEWMRWTIEGDRMESSRQSGQLKRKE
jgi:hypothetical protein